MSRAERYGQHAFNILLMLIATTGLVFIFRAHYAASADASAALTAQSAATARPTGGPFWVRMPFFAPSAIISLTSDNSTFFLARPAAFGPELPELGLSADLWVGRGFGAEFGCEKGDEEDEEDEAGAGDDGSAQLRLDGDGLGASVDSGQPAPEPPIAGSIALVARGKCSFIKKARWADARGAAGLIVADTFPNRPLVTMYSHQEGASANLTMPSVFTGFTTAQVLSRLSEDKDLAGLSFAAAAAAVATADADAAASSRKNKPVSITITPSAVSPSPILDTILVLVVSPLVTLSIVYSLVLARSRLRRHRWRAPKSFVAQLPVRTYRDMPSSASSTLGKDLESGAHAASVGAQSENTPLLGARHDEDESTSGEESSSTYSSPSARSAVSYGSTSPVIDIEGSYSGYGYSRSPRSAQSAVSAITLIQSRLLNGEGPSVPEPNPDPIAGRRGSRSKSHRRQRKWRRKYSNRQRTCVVCLDDYVDGVSQVMSLPCGHDFHQDCITPWLTTRRRTCPMCKVDVVRAVARQRRREQRKARAGSPARSAPGPSEGAAGGN